MGVRNDHPDQRLWCLIKDGVETDCRLHSGPHGFAIQLSSAGLVYLGKSCTTPAQAIAQGDSHQLFLLAGGWQRVESRVGESVA
jgi:hypothetical protein